MHKLLAVLVILVGCQGPSLPFGEQLSAKIPVASVDLAAYKHDLLDYNVKFAAPTDADTARALTTSAAASGAWNTNAFAYQYFVQHGTAWQVMYANQMDVYAFKAPSNAMDVSYSNTLLEPFE